MARSADPWAGKVAWITGASSGIGAATAHKLAHHGLRLILVARRKGRLGDLAHEITSAGGDALALPADLTRERDRDRLLRQAALAFSPVDILVNNARLGWYGYGDQMPWPVAKEMLRPNAEAVVQLTLSVLPEMRRRRSGHVINVGSLAGSLPSQGVALYGATKSFLDSFSSALHRELRGSGIRVSVVRPGPVRSEFYAAAARRPRGHPIPAERFAIHPETVANRVWSFLRRPRRVAYVPSLLSLAPWVELTFGWLIDRLGPLLFRHTTSLPAKADV